MARPLILVSNDDGIRAPGLRVLATVAAEFGHVIVSAPTEERSGYSHAITLRATLRSEPAPEFGPNWFAVSGTPVDCVYLAALHLCDRLPDLVLAGINPGYNLGNDVFYSGTVAAAREGVLRGSSGLAVSVEGGADPKCALPFIRQVVPKLLAARAAGERHLLNLNVPKSPKAGQLAVVPLGQRRYQDRVEQREDLMGRDYFWIGGPPAPVEEGVRNDTGMAASGHAALTPLTLDTTAPSLEDWASKLDTHRPPEPSTQESTP